MAQLLLQVADPTLAVKHLMDACQLDGGSHLHTNLLAAVVRAEMELRPFMMDALPVLRRNASEVQVCVIDIPSR